MHRRSFFIAIFAAIDVLIVVFLTTIVILVVGMLAYTFAKVAGLYLLSFHSFLFHALAIGQLYWSVCLHLVKELIIEYLFYCCNFQTIPI